MTQRDWLTRGQLKEIQEFYGENPTPRMQALFNTAEAYLDAQEWRLIADAPGNKQVLIAAWYDGAWYIFTGEALFWKASFENKHLRWLPLPTPPQQKERPE